MAKRRRRKRKINIKPILALYIALMVGLSLISSLNIGVRYIYKYKLTQDENGLKTEVDRLTKELDLINQNINNAKSRIKEIEDILTTSGYMNYADELFNYSNDDSLEHGGDSND